MKMITLMFVAAGTLLLTGCWQKSVQPFYTSRDIAPDEKLIGAWENSESSQDDRQRWLFKQASPQNYTLDLSDSKGNKQQYVAYLFKFEGRRFLDIVTQERSLSTIPAHHLFRISELSGTMKIAPLNTGWVGDYLKENPQALQHIKVSDPEHADDREKDEIILTADTTALQSFLRKHLDEEKLFADADTLTKVPEKAAVK